MSTSSIFDDNSMVFPTNKCLDKGQKSKYTSVPFITLSLSSFLSHQKMLKTSEMVTVDDVPVHETDMNSDRQTRKVRWAPVISQCRFYNIYSPETGEQLEGRQARAQAKRDVLGDSWQETFDIVYRNFRGNINTIEDFILLEEKVACLPDPCLCFVGEQWRHLARDQHQPRPDEDDCNTPSKLNTKDQPVLFKNYDGDIYFEVSGCKTFSVSDFLHRKRKEISVQAYFRSTLPKKNSSVRRQRSNDYYKPYVVASCASYEKRNAQSKVRQK